MAGDATLNAWLESRAAPTFAPASAFSGRPVRAGRDRDLRSSRLRGRLHGLRLSADASGPR
jgi:hypothetical protein